MSALRAIRRKRNQQSPQQQQPRNYLASHPLQNIHNPKSQHSDQLLSTLYQEQLLRQNMSQDQHQLHQQQRTGTNQNDVYRRLYQFEDGNYFGLGPMTISCGTCSSLLFWAENLVKSSNSSPQFQECCQKGSGSTSASI